MIVEMGLTLIEIWYCGFIRVFLCLVSRVLFSLRFLGIQIDAKVLIGLEGAGFLFGILIPPLFKVRFSISKAFVYLFIGLVISLIELYESHNNIYFDADVTEEHYKVIHVFRLKKGRVEVIREKTDYCIYFLDSNSDVKFESKVSSKNLSDEALCNMIYKEMENIYPVLSNKRDYILDTLLLRI